MKEELESLYHWYGERLDLVTDHHTLLRYQAARQILRHLFSGTLELNVTGRYQHTNATVQDYMAQDAFDSMEGNHQ